MKYIGYYDTTVGRRNMCLAAVNKMNYIAEALNNIGLSVEIISLSTSTDKTLPLEEKLNEKTTIKYFKALKKRKGKIGRIINVLAQRVKIFTYCMKNIAKEEEVIVYHSLGLMSPVYLAKKIKGFKLILEVEEFYNDVHKRSNLSPIKEKIFIDCADKYIFPTDLLNCKFNKKNKPYALICGTYKAEKDRICQRDDEKIHVVYAGTFDFVKGGVLAAIESAKYLSENYHLHIAGFGTGDETKKTLEKIEEISKKSGALITYEGLLSGEEYIRFIQSCHIGLSTQNPEADFNASSFPSKILSYMANGLRVVTIDIPAVKTSDVGEEMYYYDKQSGAEIAKAIMSVDLNEGYDSREKLERLDRKFTERMKALLKEV